MLALRGVKLRANNYFWGVCLAVAALALAACCRSAIADETDPGKSTSPSNAARLEAEIQRLHEELVSTKELLRQATSNDDELLLAQRGDGPARATSPPSDPSNKGAAKSADDKKVDDKKADDKKYNSDAWRSLSDELGHRGRPGPGGPGWHPGMRGGFGSGPPMWAQHGFGGGPPWMQHRGHGHSGHGHGGHGWAHHHHRGHHHWARHGRHGGHHRWAHHHGHHRRGHGWAHHHRGGGYGWQHDGRRGGPPMGDRGGWAQRGPGGFGPGMRGGDGMPQIARRLNLLEEKIDALMREVHATHDGPDRGGPRRDGPPHDGPPRDGPPRDGGPRDAAPSRKPGE